MDYKDYYKILGVDRDSKQEEVKRAYRKLVRKYHPDVSKEADAEARFKEVREAYEVLKDPRKIARSLKKSANMSKRRKVEPFRSAMSMLVLYINRAGKNLDEKQRRVLESAKGELRSLYGKKYSIYANYMTHTGLS